MSIGDELLEERRRRRLLTIALIVSTASLGVGMLAISALPAAAAETIVRSSSAFRTASRTPVEV